MATSLFVNSDWSGCSAGDLVFIGDDMYIFGTDAFADIQSAVNAASTTEATTINVFAGTYDGNIYFLDSKAGGQKADITIQAAEGVAANDVNISGSIQIGKRGSESWGGIDSSVTVVEKWDSDVTIQGVTLSGANVIVDYCEDVNIANCVVDGANVKFSYAVPTVTNSDFKNNAYIQTKGTSSGDLTVSGGSFTDSRINITSASTSGSAKEAVIENVTFNCTIPADQGANSSFYAIRSKGDTVVVQSCEFNVDSELADSSASPTEAGDWSVLRMRTETSTLPWTIEDCTVNFSEAAANLAGLDFIVNDAAGENATNVMTVTNLTATTYDDEGNQLTGDEAVEALAKDSSGYVGVVSDDGSKTLYDDGAVAATSNKVFVNASWTSASELPEGAVWGFNAFSSFTNAYNAVAADGSIKVSGDDAVDGAALTDLDKAVTIDGAGEITLGTASVSVGIAISGVKLTATSLTNSGTITASGTANFNIGTLTGNGISFADGVTVKDSVIGGTLQNIILGKVTFDGDSTISGLTPEAYGTEIVVGAGDSLTVTGARLAFGYDMTFSVTGEIENALTADKTEVKLSLGYQPGLSITGGGSSTFTVKDAYVKIGNTSSKNTGASGKFELTFTNSIVDFTNQYQLTTPSGTLNPEFITTFDGSVVTFAGNLKNDHTNSNIILKNGTVLTASLSFKNNGDFQVLSGSRMTVNGYSGMAEHAGQYNKLTVSGEGSYFTITNTTTAVPWQNSGSVFITDKGQVNVNYITNTGAITIDASSLLTGATLTNNGTITIDATNLAANTAKKVIDLSQDAPLANVTVTGNVKALYGDDGDVIVHNIDQSTLYVNKLWATGYEVGDAIAGETGKYYGINAFSSINDASKAAAPSTTAATIDLTGTGDNYLSGAANFNYGQNVILTGTAAIRWQDGWLFVGRGNNGFTANDDDTTVTIKNASITSKDPVTTTTASTGFNVSGATSPGSGTNNGILNIENSSVECDYLVNRNEVTISNSTVDLVNLYVHGRKASESRSGIDETATLTIQNGSSVTVKYPNGLDLGSESYGVINITDTSSFVLTNGAYPIAAKGTINMTETATFTATNGGINNAGAINLTTGNLIEASSITGAGTITIDATGFTGGVKKVIDLDQSSALSNVTLNAGETGAKLVLGSDGDVIVHNLSPDTLYVNSAWSDKKVGDMITIGEGASAVTAYYGIDAFAQLADFIPAFTGGNIVAYGDGKVAATETSSGEGIEIDNSGTYNLTGTEWTNVGYLQLNAAKEQLSTHVVVKIDNANLVATKIQARRDADFVITDSHLDFENITASRGYTCIYANSTLTLTNSVYGYNHYLGNSSEIVAGRAGFVEGQIKPTDNFGKTAVQIDGKLIADNSTLFTVTGDDQVGFGVQDKGYVELTGSVLYAGAIAIGVSQTNTEKQSKNTGVDVATMVLDNSIQIRQNADNYKIEVGKNVASALIVRNNSLIDRADAPMTVSSGSSVDISTSTVKVSALSNAGTITLDTDSLITAASLTGAGSITIDATAGLAANTIKKVIDITGTDGFDATNVSVTGEGVRKLQGNDGDVFVTNETADTYYVNADWSSKEIGETVTTAKGVTAKYGISAFSTFSDAYAAASAHTGVEDIFVESDIVDDSFGEFENVNVKNGTAAGTAVSISNTYDDWIYMDNVLIGQGVTISTPYWCSYNNFTVDGSLLFTGAGYHYRNAIVTISETGYLGKDVAPAVSDKHIVLRYSKNSSAGIYVTGNAAPGAEEADRTLQLDVNYFSFYSGTISLKDTLAQSGPMWMNAAQDAASYAYKDFLNLDNAIYKISGVMTMSGDATVNMINQSKLSTTEAFTVNADSKVNVDATSAITTNAAFANHGALNITVGGTVTAKSFTNDGMITIDVTGFEGVSADIITVTNETGSEIDKKGVTLDGTGAGNFAVITKDNGGVSIVRVGEDVYIWDGCANLPTGTAVSVNGVTAFVGVDAFATLDDALTTAGKTIYFKSSDAPALAITDHLNGSSLLKASDADAEADVIVAMGSSDSPANNMLTGDLTIGEGVTFAATKLVHRNTDVTTTITVKGTFQSVKNAYLYVGVMDVAATGKLTGDDVFLNGSGDTSYELNVVTGDGLTEQVHVASLRIGAAATANFTNTIVSAASLSVTAATGVVNASNTTIKGNVTNAGTINFTDTVTNSNVNGDVTNNGTINLAAGRAVVANGNIVNNGTVNFKEDSLLQANTITNNGTFAIEGTRAGLVGAVSNAGTIDIAAGQTLAFSGESSLTNDAAGTINVAGTIEAAAVENNGTINVTGAGATFTGDVVSTGTIEVTGTVTVTGAITNNATGAITIDAASSLLSATSIANNGTITIDTTGFTGMKKIIDLDGVNQTITGEGTITIDGTAELVYHGEDSSYYLSNVDQSVLYVSNAWSTAVYGQEVETGKFYGINAFSALRGEKGALDVAMPRTADTTITFEGTSFSEAYDYDIMANFSGNVEFKGSPVTLNQTAGGRMDLCVSPAAGTTATISTPITAASSDSLAGIWLNFTGEGTTKVSSTITAKTYIGINSNVNVDKDATLTTEADLQIGRAKDAIATNATITGTDRTFGTDEYQVSAQGIQLNEGTATVTGSKVKANTLSVTDTFAFNADTGAYTGAVTLNSTRTTWDLASIIVGFYTADAIGGYLTPGASTFNFTDSVINVGAIKNQAYFIPSDDGQIDENRAIEGYALTINLDGTTLKAASILNNGTIALTDSSTATVTGAITGTGTITVDASTLSFGGDFAAGTLTLSNGGTVAAISGDRVLNIGTFTGTITVDDDANLTGSAVDGTGDIEVLSGVTLTLDGKTEEEATSFGAVTNAGTIDIDSKFVNLGAIDNSGAINMDWHDMLTFTGFSGSAINFDMSGFNGIEENTKVLDFEGTGTKTAADYQAMLGFDADYLNRYFMVDGNDLYLKGGVSDTIYVHDGETIAHAVGRALDASAIRIVVEDGTFSAPADFGPVITKTSPYYDFTDNMFTGYEVVINDGTFDDSAKRITGGAVIELAGKRQYVITGGDRSVTINGGEFNGVVVGGDRLTTIGNLTHGNNDPDEEVGEFDASLSLEINGGVFKKNVAGGMMLDITNDDASVDQYGDINLTINGGTFEKFIYGGNVSSNKGFSSQTSVTGDITVTIDTVNTTADKQISINSLYAGSFGEGKVNGSTKVVLKGDGQYLSVADQLWGGCTSDVYFVNSDGTKTANSKVTGTRTLSFEGFTGDLNVKSIKMFSDVKFDAESDVDFTNFRGTMAEVENWEIAFGSENIGAFNNDFTGDSLNLTGLSGALEEPWVIFGNTSKFKNITEEGAGFAKINGSAAVLSDNLLEGEICGYDLGSYTLAFTEASDTTSAQMVLRNAVLS